MSANSVINCAVAEAEMAVNRAAQESRVSVADSHPGRQNLVGAVFRSKICPIPTVQAARRNTRQDRRGAYLVAHANEVGGHETTVVVRPKVCGQANGGDRTRTLEGLKTSLAGEIINDVRTYAQDYG